MLPAINKISFLNLRKKKKLPIAVVNPRKSHSLCMNLKRVLDLLFLLCMVRCLLCYCVYLFNSFCIVFGVITVSKKVKH